MRVGVPVTISYQVTINLGTGGVQIANTATIYDGLTTPFETNVVTTTVPGADYTVYLPLVVRNF